MLYIEINLIKKDFRKKLYYNLILNLKIKIKKMKTTSSFLYYISDIEVNL